MVGMVGGLHFVFSENVPPGGYVIGVWRELDCDGFIRGTWDSQLKTFVL